MFSDPKDIPDIRGEVVASTFEIMLLIASGRKKGGNSDNIVRRVEKSSQHDRGQN